MNLKAALIALVSLLVIIGTEFAYRKPLFKETLELAHKLQRNQSSTQLKMWNQFSLTGLGTLPVLILLMTIDYRYRANQVYWICLFTILMLVMNITKMAYHEARPFWIDPTVYQSDCSVEFGNPSGHSMTAAVLSVALAFSILHLVSGDLKRRVILGLLIFPIALIYFFAMGLSRLTLGVHSINQIVYGWVLGIWIAVARHFCLRDSIVNKSNVFL